MPNRALEATLSRPVPEAKAELFRALAHPARIRVLEVLSEGERSVGEMQPLVGIESSHLSQQLAVLRRAVWSRRARRARPSSTRCVLPSSPSSWRCEARVMIVSLSDSPGAPGRAASGGAVRSLGGGLVMSRVRGLMPRRGDYAGVRRSWQATIWSRASRSASSRCRSRSRSASRPVSAPRPVW